MQPQCWNEFLSGKRKKKPLMAVMIKASTLHIC